MGFWILTTLRGWSVSKSTNQSINPYWVSTFLQMCRKSFLVKLLVALSLECSVVNSSWSCPRQPPWASTFQASILIGFPCEITRFAVIYAVCQSNDWNFFEMYALVGIYAMLLLIAYALFQIAYLMKYTMRSTEEIFSMFIATTFTFKAVSAMVKSQKIRFSLYSFIYLSSSFSLRCLLCQMRRNELDNYLPQDGR